MQVYQNIIVTHGIVLHVCAVVTQLSIVNEEPLLETNYIVTTFNPSYTFFLSMNEIPKIP